MPATRFARMFDPAKMSLPATWGKVNPATVPREIQERMKTSTATPELANPDQARQRIAMYHANVAQLDDSIGSVIAELKALGLDQDTAIIYSSDHGEMLGDHGLWQKFVFYEPSVGVPLMVHVPGMANAGARCASPVSQVQLVATILELCGVPVPAGLDGGSLLPHVHEPTVLRDQPVFAEFALRTKNAKAMLRRGDWKYCHYANDTPELYNLRADPDEMNNLAASATHAARRQAMEAELLAWHRPA